MKPALLLITVSLLGGCTVGRDYQRPELPLPAAHRGAQAVAGDETRSLGDLRWWEVFQDPALQALIRASLEHNPDAGIAAARVAQARALAGATGLQSLPQLGLDGGYSRQRSAADQSPSGRPTTRGLWDLSLGISWELDLWGRLERLDESARAQWLAAEYNRQATQAALVSATANAWFTLAALHEQRETLRHTLGFREKFVAMTGARRTAGSASGLELQSAEAQLAAAQATLADTERQIAQAENVLSVLAGRPPAAVAPPAADALVSATLPPPDLPARLLERRPDLRAAEQTLVAANADVGAVKAALLPTLSLTGSVGAASSELSQLLRADAVAWSAGPGLLLPLLDAQRNGYRVDAAEARQREVQELYRKAVLTALREVADALVERQRQAEVLQAQQRQTQALTQAREIALARYRVGYASYFEVINAERDLATAQLQLTGARRGLQLAMLRLYLALGGGWTPAAAEPAATGAATGAG